MLAPYDTLPLRAIAFKVIVQPEAEPERVIEVFKHNEDAFRVGRVLSIGQEAKEKLPDLREGDRVLYSQSTSCTTAVKGRHIVHHDHILCAIDESVARVQAETVAPGHGATVNVHRPVR